MDLADRNLKPDDLWHLLAPQAGLVPSEYKKDRIWTPPGTRVGTFVMRYRGPKGHHVVLKSFSKHMESERFDRIATTMRDAGKTMAGSTSRIPQIHAYDAKTMAMIMEFLPGQELFTVLEKSNRHERYLERAGQWFRAFHNAAPVEPRKFWPKPHLERLREARSELQRGDLNVCNPEEFLAALNVTIERLKEVRGEETLTAWQHGDPNLHNFILGDDALWALDFTRVARAPVGNDIAHFLAFYGALFSNHNKLAPGTFVEPEKLGAFFEGYGLRKKSDPTIRALLPVKLLHYWQKSPARRQDMTARQLFRFERYRYALNAVTSS